ncbi:MAG: hypothetical protein ABFS23_05635 [Pseudomonadota bacterium]
MQFALRLLIALFSICIACPLAAASVEEQLAIADQAWQDGRLDDAGREFEATVAAHPQSTHALMRLAGFQLSRGAYTDGLNTYQDVLGLRPEGRALGNTYLGMALAYLHTGNRQMALVAFQQAQENVAPERRAEVGDAIAELKAQLSQQEKLSQQASSHTQ